MLRLIVLFAVSALAFPAATFAQYDSPSGSEYDSASGGDSASGLDLSRGDNNTRAYDDEVRDPTDPYEDPDEDYYFAGVFVRYQAIPRFLLMLFQDEATGAANPGFGAEITYRKEGFDIVGSLWWQGFSTAGPFRGTNDPPGDTEWIDSSLSVLFASATFLWSEELSEAVAIEYGVGIGLGIVLGDLTRTEAYQSTAPGSVSGYLPCTDVGNPVGGSFCDGPPIYNECSGNGGHYCTEQRWSGGGSVPDVVPWLAIPHIALRLKPIRQLMIRIEGGFGLGFFAGGSINAGF